MAANNVPELPPRLTGLLRTAQLNREVSGSRPFLALVLSLRRAGWPLSSIALATGVSREAVRQWHNAAEAMGMDLDLPEVPSPPPANKTKEQLQREESARRRKVEEARQQAILDMVLPGLLEVKEMAEGLRGPSECNPARAAASALYTRRLHEAVEMDVNQAQLARALGIKPVTIAARLRRGGYRPKAPSEKSPLPYYADGPYATAGVRRGA